MLVRVEAPHFVAGLVMEAGICVEAAPILRWAIGKDQHALSWYFKRRGWRATIVKVTKYVSMKSGQKTGQSLKQD